MQGLVTIQFYDDPDMTFNTVSCDAIGGFIVIVEQLRGSTRRTFIPSARVKKVIVENYT